MLKHSGKPIQNVGGDTGRINRLAADNKLTAQAVYKYIASDRNILTYKGAIYEVKKLEGKQ